MPYEQVIELVGPLGNFANFEPYEVGYEIEIDYGRNIDPVSGTVMILEL